MRNMPPFAAPAREPGGSGGGPSAGTASAAPARNVDAQAVNNHIQRTVTRLMEVVDEETAALRDRKPVDLREYNNRKAHSLLELDRAMTIAEGVTLEASTLALIAALRDKLNANSRVLGVHIEAVREVATIIADTIREAESDGTYTHAYRSKGPAP